MLEDHHKLSLLEPNRVGQERDEPRLCPLWSTGHAEPEDSETERHSELQPMEANFVVSLVSVRLSRRIRMQQRVF